MAESRQDRIEAAARRLMTYGTPDVCDITEWNELRAALAEPYVCRHCEVGFNDPRDDLKAHTTGPGGVRCSRETK